MSLVLSSTELRERTKLGRNKLWRTLTRLQLDGAEESGLLSLRADFHRVS